MYDAWRNFKGDIWKNTIDVAEFIRQNYEPFSGDGSFLEGPSKRTTALWDTCRDLLERERKSGGVLSVDTSRASGILAYEPGYIHKDLELIVGLQTTLPLERPVHCEGGIRMAEQACHAYGQTLNPEVGRVYHAYRKTHNDAVFAAYTPEMKRARHLGLLTGLPDSYGRGRIIGDYRRVPLYGVDKLIAYKKQDLCELAETDAAEGLRLRDEITGQIASLEALAQMADRYGCDIRVPASTARQAVQALYLAYLGALKEQNGAAMSLGRVSSFLDTYFERDLREGILDEPGCQELVDQLIIKLRMARMLRTPEYNQLFAGDPLWITESIGGIAGDGRPMITKNSYRFLQTLRNLGPAPEPNLTVLWSAGLPDNFKRFCASVSIETSSIQYENDDLMRARYGDDYAIACCVSAMKLGKEMQFFGARCNLPKLLLLAINGGRDELIGEAIGPSFPPMSGKLDFDEVWKRFERVLDWFCPLYVDTMNLIHYMHDKYCYEALQMALHETRVERNMAFGIAGLSIVCDSLSAIKHAGVYPNRNGEALTDSFAISGEYPAFGNDDDRADSLAIKVIDAFMSRIDKCETYRSARPTLSILTITSNVVYGNHTGATPDGRKSGEPFAPGANPMHGRDRTGLLAALNSVAKLPYDLCRDGISYTISITPSVLGKTDKAKSGVLAGVLDGYFSQDGHHLNINVIDRETLRKAMENPELFPNLTLRVSGYAVHFHKLSREQQMEIIGRTYFDKVG